MTFKIGGFGASQKGETGVAPACETYRQTLVPRKSLVQVRFPGKGMALAYYNDQFDLKPGDRVYVDGKLEGLLGRVTEVNYNFKIKVSDYKKVIAVVDTDVSGAFHMAGSHFVTFDPAALSVDKIKLWFNAPEKEDEEVISSSDDSSFPLSDLNAMRISAAIAERGHNYYLENRVSYLCLDGTRGFAIVEGNKSYFLEFRCCNGEISHLICDCPCACACKHEFAAMLQLRETLELISKHYSAQHARSGYFAAIAKGILFSFAIDGKETGSFTIQ